MLSNKLAARLTPFKHIVSRTAAAPMYRAIELSPDKVKGCSSFAVLEAYMEIGVDHPVYIDALSFLSIVSSLPPNEELKLSQKDGSVMWTCGPASGKLAIMEIKEVPGIPPEQIGTPVKANKLLGHMLDFGALSCDSAALGAAGVYGVTIYNDKKGVLVCSTDNTTVSSATSNRRIAGVPELVTLPPPGSELLGAIIDDDGTLEFGNNGVIYQSEQLACYVRQVPALTLDTPIKDIVEEYSGSDIVARIPQDRIAAFVRRANALTENKRHARVLVAASDGCLNLSFQEGTSESEEFILSEELTGVPDIEPVPLSASKVARALSYIDSIVLDYVDRNVMILTGSNSGFRYLISGTSR